MTDDKENSIRKMRTFHHDNVMKYVLMAVASVTVVIIFFIILFILINGAEAIGEIGIIEFITGTIWKPGDGAYG
ncbi:MAG: hypothetical protein FWD37_06920, partial [Methanomassiliicoccaceae archaeon]|nr:hypothetical protein [Methanomassiliicoccaceae archaeon]